MEPHLRYMPAASFLNQPLFRSPERSLVMKTGLSHSPCTQRGIPSALRRNQWLRFGIGLLIATSIAVGTAVAKQRITRSYPHPDTVIIRIDEPVVSRRETTYPDIVFHEGDRVSVQAGGCVQTGGIGKTWKRYVNPSGPSSNRLYQGLIWIPAATEQMVRISDVIGRPLRVSSGDVATTLILHLGYQDNDYDDNGYWEHDDGTGAQCKGASGGSAWVQLTITRPAH